MIKKCACLTRQAANTLPLSHNTVVILASAIPQVCCIHNYCSRLVFMILCSVLATGLSCGLLYDPTVCNAQATCGFDMSVYQCVQCSNSSECDFLHATTATTTTSLRLCFFWQQGSSVFFRSTHPHGRNYYICRWMSNVL